MKFLKILFAFTALFGSYSLVCGQPNAWNGIVPLISTRANVENILGKPTPMPHSVSPYIERYITKDGRISVTYSTGPCMVKSSNGWDVPEFTVVSILFHPDDLPKVADVKLDQQRFEKRPDQGVLYTTVYTSKTDGISLTVDDMGGSVVFFNYFPESKYDYLKCKKPSPQKIG